MDPALRTSATGMIAQNQRVAAIAHNIANVGTAAFKASRPHFEDLLYQTVKAPQSGVLAGEGTTDAVQIGRGVRLVANTKVFRQGPLEETGRALDFAIEGEGFFPVEMPDGTVAYTRDGSLALSGTDGALQTRGGYRLASGIRVPADAGAITVSPDGIVTASIGNGAESIEIGQLELVRFVNPEGLLALGENLYAETAASGTAQQGVPQQAGFGRLIQGAREGSNVEAITEMVDMIAANRAYDMNARGVQTADQMMEQVIALVR